MRDVADTIFDDFPVYKGSSTATPRIILHSQVRIMRNLSGRLFPLRADSDDLKSIRNELFEVIGDIRAFESGWRVESSGTNSNISSALTSFGYVGRDWSSRPDCGVAISSIRDASLEINYDDHVSLNVFRPGLSLTKSLQVAESLMDEIALKLDFVRHARMGYLTSRVSDAGLGIRIGVSLHLPVLRMIGRIRPIVRGLEALGISVTNSLGALGKLDDDVLKIWHSCAATVPVVESISFLMDETERLQSLELEARAQILNRAPEDVFDRIGRCYGALSKAYKLSELDARRFFSGLRLGIDIGTFANLDHVVLDNVELGCGSCALSRKFAETATTRMMDVARADHVRRALDILR